MLLIVVIVMAINVNAQVLYGGGAVLKIHEVNYFEVKKNFEPVIYAAFFLGKKYEEGNVTNKVIETGVNLGLPTSTILAKSFSKGFAYEGEFKFSLESKNKNPLGLFVSIVAGRASILPKYIAGEKGKVNYFLGKEAYAPFIEMAKKKERMSISYVDIEPGISFELDQLKFSGSYGLKHKTIGLSITRDLPFSPLKGKHKKI